MDAPPPDLGALGREVIDLAQIAGLTLDPWQAWIMEHAHVPDRTRKFWNPYTNREEFKWAATEVGVMVSRQNGKGSILEARELAGLFIFGERLIIHSAHQFDTSKEAFERILVLLEGCPDLEREIKRISRSHGEEGIELKNNQRLRFRTRTKGGGRGFTSDCLILDEAMYLGATQIGALLPTLSARPNAQIWVTGSAGDKESTHFGKMRSRAIAGDDPRLFYAEWSIEPCTDFCTSDCEEHDAEDTVESYAKANPGLGIRISVEHVESERRSMDSETFAQERLGVGDWPVEGDEWRVISEESWNARADEFSEVKNPVVLAIDTSPDRKYSSIAAAGINQDEMMHVEITSDGEQYDHRPGIQWVIPAIKEMWKALKPAMIVIDKRGPALTFWDELESAGIKLVSPTAAEYAQACGDFYSSVIPRKDEKPTLVHLNQPPLSVAVAGADKRDLADTWAWSRRDSTVDISPLCAVTLAAWGYRKHVHGHKTSAPWVAYGNKGGLIQ